jgi:signal-transduction protein with cAMP-binding, CBS, and nucleotidyltransferase domain
MLFVKVPRGNEMVKVDSAEVIHGVFRMQGETDSAFIASLFMDEQSIMPIVVEEGNIQIQIDNARIIATGTPLNEILYDFVGQKNSLDDRAYEVERLESRLIMDGKPMEEVETEITQEREKLAQELDELVKTFIQANYENVLGPGIFIMMCNGFPYPILTPMIEEIVDAAPEYFKNHNLVKEYMEAARENMERLKAER